MSSGEWNVALISAVVYTMVSVLATGAFFAVTVLTGDYSWVARVGGSAWVFLLSMIILMPTVTPWLRRRPWAASSPPSACLAERRRWPPASGIAGRCGRETGRAGESRAACAKMDVKKVTLPSRNAARCGLAATLTSFRRACYKGLRLIRLSIISIDGLEERRPTCGSGPCSEHRPRVWEGQGGPSSGRARKGGSGMRQLAVALLVGLVLFAAVWVLAVAPAMTDSAAGGDANGTGNGTGNGWGNISLYGSP